MTDIPADVLEAARAWTSGWKEVGGHSDLHIEAVRTTIARAILADRAAQAERMARMDEKALIMAEVSWAENRREAISPKEMGWLREAIEAYLADIAARALSQEGS